MDALFVTLPNVVDIIIQVPIFVGLSERVSETFHEKTRILVPSLVIAARIK